jgi:hypothetical protein
MFKNRYIVNYILAFFCSLLCLVNYSCFSGTSPEDIEDFGLYQLEDESITWEKFQNITNKDTLRIKEWITPKMIKSYDFSSHILTLNINAEKELPAWRQGVFVAVVGGVRCYYGSLNPNYGAGRTPVWWEIFNPAQDMVWLIESSNLYYKDERNDERVKYAVKSAGKYQGGIKVTLDDLSAAEEHDTAFFKYSFTVTNIDDHNLYLIDPNDVANNWFAFGGVTYNTALYIYDKDREYEYRTYRLEPFLAPANQGYMITQDNLKPENLLYIKKGESVTRTYKQTMVNSIRTLPYGNYRSIICYANVLGATAEQRTISGERVLCGFVYSNIFDITYSKENGIVVNNRNVILE